MKTTSICTFLLECIALPLFLLSCRKLELKTTDDHNLKTNPAYVEYTITKGEHFSHPGQFKTFSENNLQFEVMFDSSCQYTTVDKRNANDINKLYGFADCGTHHHDNSARFGWKWNGKNIDLFAYCYVKGERYYAFVDTVSLMAPLTLSISAQDDKYIFACREKEVDMERNDAKKTVNGYLLYPYFGGDEVAPRDMKIYLKDLKN